MGKLECIRYVNFDYAGDLDKRWSTTGYVFTLSQALVSWLSILKSIFLLRRPSMAMMEAMNETIWLLELLDDLGIEQDLLNINCDSMGAIYLAKNQVYHERTKHINVRFHFVWEILNVGDIELKKIHTKENLTDILKKVVPGVKFAYCKELLHILEIALVWWSSFK